MGLFGTKTKPGDEIVRAYQQSAANPKQTQHITWCLAEGATEDDIRQWHNLSVPQRTKRIDVMKTAKLAIYLAEMDRTDDNEAAADFALRRYPFYGSPDGPAQEPHVGDDRPLPIELSQRIENWFIRNGLKPGAQGKFDEAMERHATLNGFIRSEMVAGRL